MRDIEFKGHTITIWDSAEQLPIRRYQKLNKFLMRSSDIGENFHDVDRRITGIMEYFGKDMKTKGLQEFENLRQLFWNIFEGITDNGKAFAILVHSIDGKEYRFTDDNALDEILDDLERIGYPFKDMVDQTIEVKKKSSRLWNFITRGIFTRETEGRKTKES